MDKPGKTVKKKLPRSTFKPEIKAEAVRLCRIGDRSIAQVAKDLDLTETALRDRLGPPRRCRRRQRPVRCPHERRACRARQAPARDQAAPAWSAAI